MIRFRRSVSPMGFNDQNKLSLQTRIIFGVIGATGFIFMLLFGIKIGLIAVILSAATIGYLRIHQFWVDIGQPRLGTLWTKETYYCYLIYRAFQKELTGIASNSWETVPIVIPAITVSHSGNGYYYAAVENRSVGSELSDKKYTSRVSGRLPQGLTITNTRLTIDGNGYIFEIDDTHFNRQLTVSNLKMDRKNTETIKLDIVREWDYLTNPGCIATGKTGSGKSYFVSYLYLSFLAKGANVTVVDPKAGDLGELSKGITDIKEGLVAIEALANNMTNKETVPYEQRETDILIVDELASMKSELTKTEVTRLDHAIKRIALMGRTAKTILILVAQQANAQNLPTEIREQMGLRVIFGNAKRSALSFLFPDFEGEYQGGRGVGLLSLDSGTDSYTAPKLANGLTFEDVKKQIIDKE